jgi:hypothetical protein
MNTAMILNLVIPAKAGIQLFHSTCIWVLSRVAGILLMTGFPLSRE